MAPRKKARAADIDLVSFPRGTPVLALLSRVDDASFSLIANQRGKRAPGGVRPRRPRLTEATMSRFSIGVRELGAVVLDAAGTITDHLGFPAQEGVYHEWGRDGQPGRLRRWPRPPIVAIRKIHIPIRSQGRFVLIFRSEVRSAGGGRTIVRTPLFYGRLDRSSAPPPVAPVSVPLGGLGALPPIQAISFRSGPSTALLASGPVTPPPNGYLKEIQTINPGKDPATHFDVVITGDGYSTDDELTVFEELADDLIDGLKAMAPFKRRKNSKLSFHKVIAVSTQSGITDVIGGAGVRKTYFYFQTDADGNNVRYIIGTPYPEIVMDAAAGIAPWSQIDLVIVICNLDLDTAHAWRGQRIVAISKGPGEQTETFVQTAAHEIGHVIAGLCDEYICCDAYDGITSYPNMATDDDRTNDTEPWRDIAQNSDFRNNNPANDFKLVHTVTDPWNNATGEPDLPEADLERLGAFWGCEFTDPMEPDPYLCADNDARGADFYRSMGRCRMRSVDREFCPACSEAIGDALDAVAAPTAAPAPAVPAKKTSKKKKKKVVKPVKAKPKKKPKPPGGPKAKTTKRRKASRVKSKTKNK